MFSMMYWGKWYLDWSNGIATGYHSVLFPRKIGIVSWITHLLAYLAFGYLSKVASIFAGLTLAGADVVGFYIGAGFGAYLAIKFGLPGIMVVLLAEPFAGQFGFPYHSSYMGACYALCNVCRSCLIAYCYIPSVPGKTRWFEHFANSDFYLYFVGMPLALAVFTNLSALFIGVITPDIVCPAIILFALGDFVGLLIWLPTYIPASKVPHLHNPENASKVFDNICNSLKKTTRGKINDKRIHAAVALAIKVVMRYSLSPTERSAAAKQVKALAWLILFLGGLDDFDE